MAAPRSALWLPGRGSLGGRNWSRQSACLSCVSRTGCRSLPIPGTPGPSRPSQRTAGVELGRPLHRGTDARPQHYRRGQDRGGRVRRRGHVSGYQGDARGDRGGPRARSFQRQGSVRGTVGLRDAAGQPAAAARLSPLPPGLLWRDWITAGLAGRAVRALHVIADGVFDGDRPLLAVSADQSIQPTVPAARTWARRR